MDPFPREILEAVAAHDGQYSWYQLDRSLTNDSPHGGETLHQIRGLLPALRELEADGLIESRPGHHPSQPVYLITAKGRLALDAPISLPVGPESR